MTQAGLWMVAAQTVMQAAGEVVTGEALQALPGAAQSAGGATGMAGGGLGGTGQDFSMLSLFLRADAVVKAVMAMLFLASIWSWAIIFDKFLALGRVKRAATVFEAAFWSGQPLEELYQRLEDKPGHPMARVFVTGLKEWRRARGEGSADSRDRAERAMTLAVDREVETLERRLPFLATVGSVAPFIGLFGTVWGIMNSFQSIAASQNTSLVVVAPGIAEALFATALGLLAAIPAVIFYNKLSSDVNRYGARLDGFSEEFAALLRRQADRRAA